MSRRIIVATQLPQDTVRTFLPDLDGFEIRSFGKDLAELDAAVECLIPLPASYGGGLVAPAVWPGPVRMVHLLSAGLDGYPEWLFEGVAVATMHGANAGPVADLAMAGILAAVKRIPEIWQESAQWQSAAVGDLAGATLGIVGFGAIGQAIAQRAEAFGMDIQAVRASDRAMPGKVRRAASLEALFASSDHVVLALPSTPQTRKLVDAALLGKARKGLHLVNVGRGDLIDETALVAALDAGDIGLATLDVLATEPPPPDHPLLHHPRARVSSHVAGNTPGAAGAMARRVRANLLAYRDGRALEGLITGSRPPQHLPGE